MDTTEFLSLLEERMKSRNKKSHNQEMQKKHIAFSEAKELAQEPHNPPYKTIILACSFGNTEVFFSLYEKYKPDVTWTDEFGNNLLVHAIKGECLPIVQFLIDNKINIDQVGRYRSSPLIVACKSFPKRKATMKKIIMSLLKAGASDNQYDEWGHNAYYYAAEREYTGDVLSCLCKSRAGTQGYRGVPVQNLCDDPKNVESARQNESD